MPALIITYDAPNWVAIPAQGIEYKFNAITYEGGLVKVREYAALMRANNLTGYADLFIENISDDTIVRECFENNDQIVLRGDPIYSAGSDALAEELEEAGEVLATLLA